MIKLGPKVTIASMDVDAQYGFTDDCPQELPVPLAHEIIKELNRQARFAQYRVGSKDAHPAQALWVANSQATTLTPINGKHMDVRWPAHCVPGTRGFELIAGLPHPADYDYFVWKGVEPDMHPYGACFHDLKGRLSTGLIEYLRVKGVQTVIVGGLATEYCVKETVLQLLKAKFQTIVNLAACRGIEPLTIQTAIKQMQNHGAIMVQSSAELKGTDPKILTQR